MTTDGMFLALDLARAATKTNAQIADLIEQYRGRGPRPWHRADGPADETPRTTHGKRVGRTHYGDPISDDDDRARDTYRASELGRTPTHRSKAFDITRSANA